jgi:3-oxoacyl-[acyl-carrier-protein] synthase II
MRKVVITGLGCVTPVGNDAASFWDSLTRGVHGIGPITKFDASDMKVSLAAEVKNFDPSPYLDKSGCVKPILAQIRRSRRRPRRSTEARRRAVDPTRFGVYIARLGGISHLYHRDGK